MTTQLNYELTAQNGAILLGLAQLLLATHLKTMQKGWRWNISARDHATPEFTGLTGRMDRAFKNFAETFPFFAAAALLIHVTGRSSPLSELGASTYLVARVTYVPIYAAGIVGLRSLIWLASLAGLGLTLAAFVL